MIYTIKIKTPEIDTSRIKHLVESKLLELDLWAFKHFGIWFWKLSYKLTGKCGSRLMGHVPVINNEKDWLWNIDGDIHTCSVCGESMKVVNSRGSFKNYYKTSRQSDIQDLLALQKKAKSETAKKAIAKSIYNINHEDVRVKAMREDLIKATRENDHAKIKEIHEYVGEKRRLRQEEA